MQMALAKDEGMIKTLLPDRADEPFRKGSRPGALGSLAPSPLSEVG